MSKHTPGPWFVYDDDNFDGLDITSDERKGMVPVATVSIGYDGPLEDEQQANAQLLAAAPEMLEALLLANEAMNYMGDIMNDMDIVEDHDIEKTTKAFDAIRAAIARATGEA